VSGDVKAEVRWHQSRYLAEHWGRTMAAQDAFAIDDFRAAAREAIRDLLEREQFSPAKVSAALDDIAFRMKADHRAAAQQAHKDRAYRLKTNGGCPTCADAEKPDPTNHADFHARMTGAAPA
jgi:hypothetical protein